MTRTQTMAGGGEPAPPPYNPTVSWTKGATATATQDTTPEAVLRGIKEGRWRQQIEAVRQADGEAREQLKKRLPAVLFSGQFSERKAAALLRHSGLLCCDLDALGNRLTPLRDALAKNVHVVGGFVSPSGNGLKILVRVPPDATRHKESFRALERYFRERYSVQIDKACSDVSRLCFASFDPDAWANLQAIEFPVAAWQPAALPATSYSRAVTAKETPAKAIQPGNKSYTLPPKAQQLFDAGPVVGQRNNEAFILAVAMRDAGFPLDAALKRLHEFNERGRPPLPSHEIESCLRSAYGRPPREPARNPQGSVRTGGEDDNETRPDMRDYVLAETQPTTPWPDPIDEAAFLGLAGDFVRTVLPHTEADPVGVLATFLAAFGCMGGNRAGALVGGGLHPARIWPILVGGTASGRKGSSWSIVRYVLDRVDPHWRKNCVVRGLATGEGLVSAVRDRKEAEGPDGKMVVVDGGILDKRLFALEEEFASVLQNSKREFNILSPRLRSAWDTGDLETLTKVNPMKATNAHIVLCGHCTKAELLKCLDNLSLHNGFANRLLFFAVRRSKFLPDGGNIHRENLNDLVTNLKAARDHAFNLPESNRILERTPEAAELWRAIYPELSGGGHGLPQLGTERAAPQVLRLSVVYALLDRRHSVDVPHLQAALAVWQYCRQSAVYIFGESSGDKNAETILAALREAGDKGLMRSEINNLLGRNLSKEQVTEALNLLCAHDLAAPTVWRHKGGKGRPATIWTVKKHEKRQNTTLHDINPTAPEEGGTFVVNIVGSGENKMPPEAQNPELETLL